MNILSKDGGSGREVVPSGAVSELDREEMRGWVQTLRRQADHIHGVAQDAEALAERIEHVLRTV